MLHNRFICALVRYILKTTCLIIVDGLFCTKPDKKSTSDINAIYEGQT